MNSIFFAVVGYFCFAVTSAVDKVLLVRALREPVAYAIAIGIASAAIIVLAPWGLTWIGGIALTHALIVGALFVGALWAFFIAMQRADATRVVPILGLLVAVFTWWGAYIFLDETLGTHELSALVFLVCGLILLTAGKKGSGHLDQRAWGAVLVSAVLFAAMFIGQKTLYLEVTFLDGLIWSRIGMVAAGACLLLVRRYRHALLEAHRTTMSSHHKILFVVGQVFGATGALAQQYALAHGSVTIVNALQGTQYAFLFLLALVLGYYWPRIWSEHFTRTQIGLRVGGITAIALGLVLLA